MSGFDTAHPLWEFTLVENLAERIAGLLMEDFRSPRVKVSVAKLRALREAQRVGVTLERPKSRA